MRFVALFVLCLGLTDPLFLQLNSGTNGTFSAAHAGTFDNLSVHTDIPVALTPVTWGAVKDRRP